MSSRSEVPEIRISLAVENTFPGAPYPAGIGFEASRV